MDLNQDPPEIVLYVRKCAHLGLMEDSQTWSSTDQLQNFCHAGKRPAPVEWAHQCQYCFTDGFVNCPVLAVRQKTARPTRSMPKLSLPLPLGAVILVVLLAALGIVIWRFGFPPLFVTVEATTRETPSILLPQTAESSTSASVLLTEPSKTPSAPVGIQPSPTSIVLRISTATQAPALVHSATPTLLPPSATPSATAPALAATTALPGTTTPGPALETPFGTQTVFLVHQVTSGEHWERLARMYDTSADVLRAVNGMEHGDTLYVDKMIVILPGLKDPNNVQPRQALYLTRETDVQALAEKYQVTVEQLRSENGLGSEQTIPGRRWLVVPLIP